MTVSDKAGGFRKLSRLKRDSERFRGLVLATSSASCASASAAARDRLPPLPPALLPWLSLLRLRSISRRGPRLCCVFVPAAALFAAHLALIAAASCSRRSGVRLSFLFALLAAPRSLRGSLTGLLSRRLICSWAWLPRVFLPLQASVSVWQVSFRLFADELRADGSFS